MEDAAAPHVQAAYRYLSRSGRGGRSSHCEPAKHEVPTQPRIHRRFIGGRGGSSAEPSVRFYGTLRPAASVVSAGGRTATSCNCKLTDCETASRHVATTITILLLAAPAT